MVGGVPLFWFFKSLDNNIVYSLGIIYLYPRGIRAEQNSYRFKNLEKLETNMLRNQ